MSLRNLSSFEGFYAYSAYGESTTLGPDFGNPLQYTGRENDGIGLYFYRARYYDPIAKRFTAEDPIGIAGGINLNAYVRGDPVSFVDPHGESAIGWIAIVAVAAVGVYTVKSWIDRLNEMKQQREDVTNKALQCATNPQACNNLEDQQKEVIEKAREAANEGSKVKDVLNAPKDINKWDRFWDDVKRFCRIP